VELLSETSENAMVLAFLRAELHSRKFALDLTQILVRHACSRALIENGDSANETENQLRREILGSWRGYQRNTFLFPGFPNDVHWNEARLTVPELGRAKYARFAPWGDLTDETLLVSDGAKNIGNVWLRDDPTNDVLAIADELRAGRPPLEPLILVGAPGAGADELVLLEGHKRATACVCVGEPEEVAGLVGFSGRISEWTPF
jgi:hypothetical protein